MGAPIGSQNALVHGGEGALKRIQNGQEFIGLAREVYDEVLAELGIDLSTLSGVEVVMVKRLAKFETAARLFDMAAESAAAEGDVDRWERMQQRSGWVGGKSFDGSKVLLRELNLGGGMVTDYEELVKREQT